MRCFFTCTSSLLMMGSWLRVPAAADQEGKEEEGPDDIQHFI